MNNLLISLGFTEFVNFFIRFINNLLVNLGFIYLIIIIKKVKLILNSYFLFLIKYINL